MKIAKMKKILVLNGPNLDMLGTREPEVYGHDTLQSLEDEVRRYGEEHGVKVSCYQSNSEGKLVGKIHEALGKFDGIVYNPGAHTHYSYALRDALGSVDVPAVEVHLSDIASREPFRRVSVIAPACMAQVKGLGVAGYCRAIDILLQADAWERLGEGCVESGAGCDAPHLGAVCALPADDGAELAEQVAQIDAARVSRERQAAVLKASGETGLDALLVRDTSNITWICAIHDVFDEERAHALLVAGGHATLHTDSRYSNAVRSRMTQVGGDVAVDDRRLAHGAFAQEALDADGDAFQGKLGIEDTVTLAEYRQMEERFSAGRLVPTSDLVLRLRAVKDTGEIARLKAAQAVTDAAFSHIIGFMRPGMTEREVQLELEDYMVRHGGEGLAFRSIVATGANGADPHAVPGSTRLEAGQCVVMDFGARAFGYCSDMTRTVFLGRPDGMMADAWNTLRRANEAAESLLKPGVTGAEAHELAERVLEEGGFGGKMGHGLGHGVGIDIHELPVLNPRNHEPLVEGNVVTVEPGIYLPGQFGMRLEDCGVITAAGYDAFTQSTHEMVVI